MKTRRVSIKRLQKRGFLVVRGPNIASMGASTVQTECIFVKETKIHASKARS